MNRHIHPTAHVDATHIGENTRVWQYCVILHGARIGTDCNICAYVFVENDVVIGSRVTIKCGVQLWNGLRVGDDVFIGPNATFTNDARPRSGQGRERYLFTTVGDGASVGANATILPGVTIGRFAFVAAGAVVTRDVANHALVVGNPAKQTSWVCLCGATLRVEDRKKAACRRCRKKYRLSARQLEPV